MDREETRLRKRLSDDTVMLEEEKDNVIAIIKEEKEQAISSFKTKLKEEVEQLIKAFQKRSPRYEGGRYIDNDNDDERTEYYEVWHTDHLFEDIIKTIDFIIKIN